jgi:tetratricopeptide (TPR) repeat protein
MFDKLARLERVYRRHPHLPLFARLADLYLRRGQVLRALALCKEGCRRFPRYPTGFVVLSRCYQTRGQLEEARIAIDQALRLDPEQPAGFLALSRIYQRLGVAPLALKSLQQAALLDPFDEELSGQVDLLSGQGLLAPATGADAEVAEVVAEEAPAADEPFARVGVPALTAPDGPPSSIALPQEDIAALLAEVESAAGLVGEPEPAARTGPIAAAAAPPPPLAPAPSPVSLDPAPEDLGSERLEAGSSGWLAGGDDGELVRLFREIEEQRPAEGAPTDGPAAVLVQPDHWIATATLAEIYTSQGLVDRAIDTYRRVLAHDPDNETVRGRLAALEGGR